MDHPLKGARRIAIHIQGVVQGVGFRPFVWRLARELGCLGFVRNESFGVFIEVQADAPTIDLFLARLSKEIPSGALISELAICNGVPSLNAREFEIEDSGTKGRPSVFVAPDLAPCEACLNELRDPSNRRFGYPFINCTHCGPRFTIIRSLPYDRERTTMSDFKLCRDCQLEYDSPEDRRYHAEPNACPACGPRVWLIDCQENANYTTHDSMVTSLREEARRTERVIDQVRARIEGGKIVAIKGIGGFHLACDATQYAVVDCLRKRKHRPDKPLAVMVADLETCRSFAIVNQEEADLLTSHQRPIVLLQKRSPLAWLEAIAPGNPSVGVLLPYSPLHHLLMQPGDIWVLTSGNLSEEPIAIDNADAWTRLSNIADSFLFHDRSICVPCDDSVVMHHSMGILPIRRSRGYAPLPISFAKKQSNQDESTDEAHTKETILAVGAEIKSTICLSVESQAFISQHIGDLGSVESLELLMRLERHWSELYQAEPTAVASDLHPGYLSTQWAERWSKAQGLPHFKIQHHHAHAASLIAEHGLAENGRMMACVFDGTGYGADGTIWGGEWLLANRSDFHRFAHLVRTPLPGGDACILRPARSALAHLYRYRIPWDPSLSCCQAMNEAQRNLLLRQLEQGIHAVDTSSMGRLFDAVAALAGVRQEIHYEGQAAIELEALAKASWSSFSEQVPPYRFHWQRGESWELHTEDILRGVIDDYRDGKDAGHIGARFHETIAVASLEICRRAREECRIDRVGLTGGVFQNELLTRRMLTQLSRDGFEVLCHHRIPPNDAGISVGQALIARERMRISSLRSR